MSSPYCTRGFFDPETWTVSYIVFDPTSRDAIVIDSVLDYDPVSSTTSTLAVDKVMRFIDQEKLTLRASLETHAHADHLTAAQMLKSVYGAQTVIGAGITRVQATFKNVFGLPADTKTDGSQFDRLLTDGEIAEFGTIKLRALATPGHTPACMSFLIGDAVFTGDALFMEDYGTGRTDFPDGSAKDLYHSVHEVLFKLPEGTRVFVGHDYLPDGRELRFESTIDDERERNVQLNQETAQEAFVSFRQRRDSELSAPRLLFQAVQVNVFGGFLPDVEANGTRYLKIPVNLRKKTDRAGIKEGASRES